MVPRKALHCFSDDADGFQGAVTQVTGQRELLVGITTADRDGVKRKELMGFRLNGLPLQSQIVGDPTFSEFLSSVKELMWGIRASGYFAR